MDSNPTVEAGETPAPVSSTSSRRGVLKAASGLMAAVAVGGVAFHPGSARAAAPLSGGSITVEIAELDVIFAAHSFQFGLGRGVANPGGGLPREASAPSVSEITISKPWDPATAVLLIEAVNPDPLARVDFRFADDKKVEFGRIRIEDVFVSGSSLSHGGAPGSTSESLSLNFTRIMVDFQGEHFGWDITEGKPI